MYIRHQQPKDAEENALPFFQKLSQVDLPGNFFCSGKI
jgi:hypothetical protein